MTNLEALQQLGLTDKEAAVYMAVVGLGHSSAYAIAEKSGLKRSTTYFILEELGNKGIVSIIPRSKKQLFRCISPEELIINAEKRLRLAKEQAPELMALAKGATTKPHVSFYEGTHGLEQTMRYGTKQMQGKELIGFYAKPTKKTLSLFNNFKDFNENLKNQRITIRGIVPSDPILEPFRTTDQAFGRQMKQAPLEDYSTTVSIEMGDNFVKIQDFDNLQSIIIENELITKAMRQIFELVWKSLPQ